MLSLYFSKCLLWCTISGVHLISSVISVTVYNFSNNWNLFRQNFLFFDTIMGTCWILIVFIIMFAWEPIQRCRKFKNFKLHKIYSHIFFDYIIRVGLNWKSYPLVWVKYSAIFVEFHKDMSVGVAATTERTRNHNF